MKKAISKLLCILLAFCMVVQYAPAAVFAAAQEEVRETTEVVVPDTELPENDELFAMYVEQELYDTQRATFGTAARENLNAVEQAIYDALKTEIEAVAASGGSTTFVLSEVSGLKTEWTREELGVESIEDLTGAQAAFTAQFSSSRIIKALLSDCPYDLYWYDKTQGCSTSYSAGRSGMSSNGTTYWTKVTFNNLTFTFSVVSAYQGTDANTVTSDVARVGTAKTNAQAVVDTYANMTAYEKMAAYKAEICQMVSYNDEAAADDYTGGYGDPWQLIYVFDDDAATEVVCEGYAKAFQYLCDLGGLNCISVSGVMAGGTGAGGHMWNIATLDGENYLVDVTNCDEGTIGAPDKLFLVGNSTGSVAAGYTFTISGQNISFTYYEDMLSIWTEEELTLAATDYDPNAEPVCPHSYESVVTAPTCTEDGFTTHTCTLCGDSYIDGETAAVGHAEETVPGYAATCTEAGLTDGIACSVCGEALTVQEEIPALGHSYENGACTGCGSGVILNTNTTATYTTLEAAVTAAAEGQTLQLQDNWAEAQIMVTPGITLDLNGHQLTSDYLVCFETAHLIDNVGTGRLIAEAKKVVLDEENAMVPVYDGAGYFFTKAGFALSQDKTYTGEGIKINALAYPVNMDVVELLKDGGADNGIQIVIRLSWDTEEGTGSQEFVFTDQVVSDVYRSNDGTWSGYAKMFSMTITGFNGIENLSANMVVVSDTNVHYVSTTSVSIT